MHNMSEEACPKCKFIVAESHEFRTKSVYAANIWSNGNRGYLSSCADSWYCWRASLPLRIALQLTMSSRDSGAKKSKCSAVVECETVFSAPVNYLGRFWEREHFVEPFSVESVLTCSRTPAPPKPEIQGSVSFSCSLIFGAVGHGVCCLRVRSRMQGARSVPTSSFQRWGCGGVVVAVWWG